MLSYGFMQFVHACMSWINLVYIMNHLLQLPKFPNHILNFFW